MKGLAQAARQAIPVNHCTERIVAGTWSCSGLAKAAVPLGAWAAQCERQRPRR